MNTDRIELSYGRGQLEFNFDTTRFDVINTENSEPSLSDFEIGAAFDAPIASPPIDEIVSSDDSVRSSFPTQLVQLRVRKL